MQLTVILLGAVALVKATKYDIPTTNETCITSGDSPHLWDEMNCERACAQVVKYKCFNEPGCRCMAGTYRCVDGHCATWDGCDVDNLPDEPVCGDNERIYEKSEVLDGTFYLCEKNCAYTEEQNEWGEGCKEALTNFAPFRQCRCKEGFIRREEKCVASCDAPTTEPEGTTPVVDGKTTENPVPASSEAPATTKKTSEETGKPTTESTGGDQTTKSEEQSTGKPSEETIAPTEKTTVENSETAETEKPSTELPADQTTKSGEQNTGKPSEKTVAPTEKTTVKTAETAETKKPFTELPADQTTKSGEQSTGKPSEKTVAPTEKTTVENSETAETEKPSTELPADQTTKSGEQSTGKPSEKTVAPTEKTTVETAETAETKKPFTELPADQTTKSGEETTEKPSEGTVGPTKDVMSTEEPKTTKEDHETTAFTVSTTHKKRYCRNKRYKRHIHMH